MSVADSYLAKVEAALRAFIKAEDEWRAQKGGMPEGFFDDRLSDAYAQAKAALDAPQDGPNSEDTIPMPKAWIEAAKCDNCGGQGWRAIQIEAGVFEQEQCQWCFERWLALGQPSPCATHSGGSNG